MIIHIILHLLILLLVVVILIALLLNCFNDYVDIKKIEFNDKDIRIITELSSEHINKAQYQSSLDELMKVIDGIENVEISK